MSRDKKKAKKPGNGGDGKVVNIKPEAAAQAGGAPASSPDQPDPSRSQTIEEVGLTLAQEILTGVMEGAQGDDELQAKMLTTIVERLCINQVLMQENYKVTAELLVHGRRAEGMLSFVMRRQGYPVTIAPAKEGDKPVVQFKTWYEEWREAWDRWERSQMQAAEGKGNDGKKDSGESPSPAGAS